MGQLLAAVQELTPTREPDPRLADLQMFRAQWSKTSKYYEGPQKKGQEGGMFQIMMKMTEWIMKFAPIGVFGLVAAVIAKAGYKATGPLATFAVVVLLALAGRRLAPWAVLAGSSILIIGFFELTCYYYSFVVLMAPLAIERLRYSVALILMVMAGLILQFFIGWYDEQYTAETVVVLVALLYILIDVVRDPLPEGSPANALEPTV